jgi:hypothetical protein
VLVATVEVVTAVELVAAVVEVVAAVVEVTSVVLVVDDDRTAAGRRAGVESGWSDSPPGDVREM